MRLLRKLIPGAVAIMLAASGPAAATAALSSSQATRASTVAAKAVAKQTHGSTARVTRCIRLSSVKTLCHAEAHYTSGAKRCTFDVTVTRAGAASRPRTAPSNFVCY